MAQSNDFSTALHSPRVRRVLQTWLHCWGSPRLITYAVHTVSFDWFLSSLVWIIYLKLCYSNFWYFTRNYYGISDLGLTLPHFESFSLYFNMFDQNLNFFLTQSFNFDQTYTGLKTQNVEELSLDLIFHNNSKF